MRFRCEGLNQSEQLKRNMEKAAQDVKKAAQLTVQDAAQEIMRRGRADIAAGGNFGGRWQSALSATVVEESNKLNIEVSMSGPPPVTYWKVFEYGATITAKNPSGRMWIPFDDSEKGIWPRDYPGSLFRIGNALFDTKTKEPKYLGTPSVTIPQKFHLREIVRQVAEEMKKIYALNLR